MLTIQPQAFYQTESGVVAIKATPFIPVQNATTGSVEISGLSTALPNRITLTIASGAVWASQAVLRATVSSGMYDIDSAGFSDANLAAIRSGLSTVERVSDTVIVITPGSGLLASGTSALPFDVMSGLFVQNSTSSSVIGVTPAYSNVPASSLVTSGIASIGTGSNSFTITIASGVLRSVEQGFNPSQVSITGSGATAVDLAIANSNASAIQAALNNGLYTVTDDDIIITGFGPLDITAGSLKVTIMPAAILTGSTNTTIGLTRISALAAA